MDTQTGTQTDAAEKQKAADGIFQKDSTQVALMAGIVTMVSQPFAQSKMQAMLGLSQSVPVIVAIIVSLLLAAHHVFAVHRAKLAEGVFLLPLVALIVFSSYAGTNQFFASEPPPVVDLARVSNLEAQLNVQKQLNDQLIKALGLVPADSVQGRSPQSPQSRSGVLGLLDKALAFLIAPAYAQDERQRRLQEEERKRLEALLRHSRLQQQKLEDERRRLEALRTASTNKAPLLKSW